MINGVTDIALTKIDVLDHFDPISAVIAYETDQGSSESLPYDLTRIRDVKLEDFPGWKDPVEGVLHYNDIPDAAVQYINSLESRLDCPITMVSTGPDRDQLIIK